MAANYVKFYRGTPQAFQNLTPKNPDTLYFINDVNSTEGYLYLGDKLIVGKISNLADLEDIVLSESLLNGDLLVYDGEEEKWINKSVLDAIGLMGRAYADSQGQAGLVPAPGIGQQELFLRGDGTWAAPVSTIQLFSDNKTIETFDGHTLSLKDFGQQYYKYVAASGSSEEEDYVASHYKLQIVDEAHPWKAGLEPKVIEENGELVLGWFEPNPTTLEGVVDELTTLQGQIDELSQDIEDTAGSINTFSTQLNTLTQTVEQKANASDVYNKTETEQKINEAVASAQHLKRKTFASLEAAQEFIASINDPDNYVYMIANENGSTEDEYIEYLYVEGSLEKVGTWEVNLEDYVTNTDLVTALAGKVDAQEGYSLISDEEKEKLAAIEAGAQKNFITSVENAEFKVDNGKLTLVEIPVAKVTNLENLLNSKADSAAVETLQVSINTITGDVNTLKTSVSSLSELIGNYDTRIGDIEDQLDSYVLKSDYETDKALIMASITWKELG